MLFSTLLYTNVVVWLNCILSHKLFKEEETEASEKEKVEPGRPKARAYSESLNLSNCDYQIF